MAKVCPQAPQVLSIPPYISGSSKRETYTIWMKSLVCHTNGCTIYNSNGDVVYRVDNYDKKCSNEVHLMDLQGKVLYTIRKKVNIWTNTVAFSNRESKYLMVVNCFWFCRSYKLLNDGMAIDWVPLLNWRRRSLGFKWQDIVECLWEA